MSEVGAEVFTENGRRAIYAGEIDGQKFVRLLLSRNDEEYGYEEWPSDNLTPVSRVFDSEPDECYAPSIEAAKANLEALNKQALSARNNVMDLQKQEREIAAAIAKFPELGTAIDFLEGRITHVTITPSYGASKVMEWEGFLNSKDDWGSSEGMKLLCLFGKDMNGKCRWSANRYYDGSGSWTEIVPHKSGIDAWAYLMTQFEAELSLWRAGEKQHKAHYRAECFPKEEWPADWREHVEAVRAKSDAERIAKLKEQIAEIEGKAP